MLRDALNFGINRRKPNTDEALRFLERLEETQDARVKELFEKMAGATSERTRNRLASEVALALVDGALEALE